MIQLSFKKIGQLFILTLFSLGLILTACSKDDDEEESAAENQTVTPSCTDGIKNQNEVDIDCGGVCPPCNTDTSEIAFKKDGQAEVISDFDANRNPGLNPSNIGLIAVTDEGNKLTILVVEPAATGWSGGLSFSAITAPNSITYEVWDSGAPVFYSSANHPNESELSFLRLDYVDGGRVEGSFSGELYNSNGDKITLSNGHFDTNFVN
ncbi:MAG: hypothetical protein RIC95_05535 [Vicingaceae bacterium]